MDHVTTARSRTERIRRLVEDYGLDEEEATFAIDLADGKTQGDIESDPPLTDEERERLGLGRSLLDLKPVAGKPARKQNGPDRRRGA